DTDGDESFIRTVPHFGYHWVPATAFGESESGESESGSTSGGVVRKARGFTPALRVARWLCVLLIPVLPFASSSSRLDLRSNRALVLPAEVDSESGHEWMRLGFMALAIERLRSAGQPVVPADNVATITQDLGSADKADQLSERVAAAFPES